MSRLEDFLVIESLRVDGITVEPRRVKARYSVEKPDGSVSSTELIYSYETAVFTPGDPRHQNLAAMMSAQVALNYGLFCREIHLEGPFDGADRSFLNYMMENTSREILTGKLLVENVFIREGFRPLQAEKRRRYTQARLIFGSGQASGKALPPGPGKPDYNKYAILSSGGKDSLLTYGLVREFGEAHPIFVNEAGRHWFTAVNSYRHFRETEPNTAKPWCNSDRVFNWMLKQLPFIREDHASIRADIYPVRLWTVAVFIFAVLPIVLKRGIGNILIGDEYDTTLRGNTQGISHYCGLYDQSKYFDNALTRYYRRKGWYCYQYSMLRSVSELLIMKILTRRYPVLQAQQISCHAAHEEEGRMRPCGKCEKCRRIVGMMVALEADPANCGYTAQQVSECLTQLAARPIKQLGSDAAHLHYLLLRSGALPVTERTRKVSRAHPEILKLRFDRERSRLEDLPVHVRKPLFDILRTYADGAVRRVPGRWEPFGLTDEMLEEPKYQPYVI